MALFAVAVPILPGKTGEWKRFVEELRGPRCDEYVASRKRLGIREQAFLQSLPQGDLVIVTLEGDNPAEAFKLLGASDDTFTQWFVQQVREIHGIDLTQPPSGMMPERYVDTLEMYEA